MRAEEMSQSRDPSESRLGSHPSRGATPSTPLAPILARRTAVGLSRAPRPRELSTRYTCPSCTAEPSRSNVAISWCHIMAGMGANTAPIGIAIWSTKKSAPSTPVTSVNFLLLSSDRYPD